MAFDGIVTKAIVSELQILSGARIDKIFQPNKNNIILGFYLDRTNYALNISTHPQNYRIHLTTNPKPNPKVAPNFCMVLRKHLIGLHIKSIATKDLERVVIIEFEGFDDIDDVISKKLVVELMGKHCNIILLDEQNTIIDSLRHISNDDEFSRNIIPHTKYSFPTSSKLNFLELKSFAEFKKLINCENFENLPTIISNKFTGISTFQIQSSLKILNINELSDLNLEKLYNFIKELIYNTDTLNLSIEFTQGDYYLLSKKSDENFAINFSIDDFYYEKETKEEFKVYRDSVLKLILDTLKKYNKRLENIQNKLDNCENMELYKLYGELITANLYRIKDNNLSEITLENYYDNNKKITIPLDKKLSASNNAKKYFKKYNKLKNALEIVSIQKQDTINELNYIESIVYELENCSTIQDVSEIFEEISENVIFKTRTDKYKKNKNIKVKKSSLTKNKNVAFNPLKFNVEGFTLLVGRNNKENDYLTLKYARKTDLWFHTKDIHGSHAVLLLSESLKPSDAILVKCAEIVAFYSKARNSSNVPVDFCEIKFVKKPNGAKPGMVIYSNNKTLFVNPKKC